MKKFDEAVAKPGDDASPRPWKLDERGILRDRDGAVLVVRNLEANARLIVASVNARHEVETLPFSNDDALGLALELRALWTKFLGDVGAGQATLVVDFVRGRGEGQNRTSSFVVQKPDGEEFEVSVRRTKARDA